MCSSPKEQRLTSSLSDVSGEPMEYPARSLKSVNDFTDWDEPGTKNMRPTKAQRFSRSVCRKDFSNRDLYTVLKYL